MLNTFKKYIHVSVTHTEEHLIAFTFIDFLGLSNMGTIKGWGHL